MNVFESILSRVPPNEIYHYTSQTGLLGIVKNKQIWATQAQYQNDSKEFIHAFELSRCEMGNIQRGNITSEEDRLLRLLNRDLETMQSVNIFVSSFSEHKDMLSQWRGYCPRGNGYSVGFDVNTLKSIIQAHGFNFVPCIYDENEQRKLIHNLIFNTLNLFKGDLEKSINIKLALRNRSNEYRAHMFSLAPIIKDANFAEEAEWRAVSLPTSILHSQIAFREGFSMLTPYFIIKFNNEQPIRSVVVGPTPHANLSRDSVSSFLISNNIKYFEIRNSRIPYRSW